MRAFLKSCNLFVKSLFAGLNSHDPIILSLSLSLKRSASESYKFEAHQINCVLTGSLRIQSNNALSAIT